MAKTNTKDMTHGPEWKLILLFTLPLIGGNLLQQIYSLADGLVVGNFVGSAALAAVGTCMPLTYLLLALATGLTNGVGIIVAQYFGAGDLSSLRRSVSTALVTITITAIVVTVAGYLAAHWLLAGLLGTPENVLAPAETYLKIYCCGLLFQFAYNTFASILRALGDSRSTFYFLVISTVLNIVLDLALVQTWGIAGVAWATVTAQAVSAICAMVYLFKKVTFLRYGKGEFVVDGEKFKLAMRLGVPTSIQQCAVGLGMVLMQVLINSFGENAIAATTAGMRVEQFAMVPIMMFYMGLSNFVGQNMGAGHLDRVKRGYRQTMAMTLGCCAAIIVVILFVGKYIIGFFGMNAEAEAMGCSYIQTLASFFLIFGIMYVTDGVLQGSGDVLYPTIASTTSLVVRVVIANIMAHIPGIGYRCIYWSIPVGWVCGSAIVLIRYASGKWKEKGIVKAK
jgi:putative MATE family efflux protein